jgi:hypothetical protein
MPHRHAALTVALAVALAVAVLAAVPAGAQSPPPTLPRTSARAPLVLRSDIRSDDGVADPSRLSSFGATADGIDANAVARLSVFVSPTSGFSCSGALVGPHTILTAAHCVTDDFTGALVTGQDRVRARFVGPGDALVDVWSRAVAVRPEWLGFYNEATDGGADVALVDFADDLPNWLSPYGLFHGDALFRPTDFIGYGEFGNGRRGALGFDADRRWGQNRVDLVSDPFFGDGTQILWTDFDNGVRANDAFCWATGFGDDNQFCDRGRGDTEMSLGAGDSGGPLFIDGRLAGVASFGTVFCGDALCASVAAPPLYDPLVLEGWGALNGFASVQYNEPWILDRIRAFDAPLATPEPTTLALAAAGVLALACRGARRSFRA